MIGGAKEIKTEAEKIMKELPMTMNAIERKGDVEIHDIFGVIVEHNLNTGKVILQQNDYMTSVLEKYIDLDGTKNVPRPLPWRLIDLKIEDTAKEKLNIVFQILGSVNHSTKTRWDLIPVYRYASSLAGGLPTLELLKKILEYCRTKRVLVFDAKTDFELEIDTDSDYASGKDRKSITGIVQMLSGCAVSVTAKKQTCITNCPTEAELTAAHKGFIKARESENFIDTTPMLKNEKKKITKHRMDNSPGNCFIKSINVTERLKHINIKLLGLREQFAKNFREFVWVPRTMIKADYLTHPIDNKLELERALKSIGIETRS